MKLGEILTKSNLSYREKNIKIKGLSRDMRSLARGDLFFIMPGARYDVISRLKEAANKAAAFIASDRLKPEIAYLANSRPVIFVKDIEKELRRAADVFYDISGSKLKIVGVTGTNGKTTTAFLIYELLKSLGRPSALIGTLKYCIADKIYRADYTTPELLGLRRIIKKAESAGCEFLVMEVSSHALAQERCRGIKFSSCIFTNLSRDHLDYHKSMANYFAVKKKLFLDNKKATALINIDDTYGKKLYKAAAKKISYGSAPSADIRAYDIELTKGYSRFKISYKGKNFTVKSSLCGRYNVSNILAAVSCLAGLGFPLARAVKNLKNFRPPEGRLQPVSKGVFVDYAHTPDALSRVLDSLREIGYEKIICVFGCGGSRDKGKRRLMGRLACQQADFSFITSDNPRRERPSDICRQIEKGFSENNYRIVIDREKAIKASMKLFTDYKGLNHDCCLLVAGKGHEDYQIIGDQRIAFKDSRIIRDLSC